MLLEINRHAILKAVLPELFYGKGLPHLTGASDEKWLPNVTVFPLN